MTDMKTDHGANSIKNSGLDACTHCITDLIIVCYFTLRRLKQYHKVYSKAI